MKKVFRLKGIVGGFDRLSSLLSGRSRGGREKGGSFGANRSFRIEELENRMLLSVADGELVETVFDPSDVVCSVAATETVAPGPVSLASPLLAGDAVSYNADELRLLQAFLNQTDGSATNGAKLNAAYDAGNPESFGGVTWTEIGGEMRVTEIDWGESGLIGSLDLSGFASLEYLDCRKNSITNLDLSGCAALASFDCGQNLLASLDLSDCDALVSLDCADNSLSTLALTSNVELQYLTCGGNQFEKLYLQNNVDLHYLSCWNGTLSKVFICEEQIGQTRIDLSEGGSSWTWKDAANNTLTAGFPNTANARIPETDYLTAERNGQTILFRQQIQLTDVTISGTAEVGEELTAALVPQDAAATYQWYRGAVAISGATGASYTVQTVDVGFALTVTATGYDDYAGDDSDTTAVIPKVVLAVPTLTVAAEGADKIKYAIGSVEHADGYQVEYSLNSNFTTSTSVPLTSAGEYTLSDLAANRTYYFRVKAAAIDSAVYADSDWSETKSAATEKISLTDVTISGTAEVGETLTATIVPTGADVIYQWYRGTEAISGAIGASYTVQTADVGYILRVQAIGTGDYQGEDSDVTEAVPKVELSVPAFSVSALGPAAADYTIGSVEHAGGYLVEYSLNSDFTSSTSVTQTTAGDYTLSDLAANRTYYFRVKATGDNVYADSAWSETKSATTSRMALGEVIISGSAVYNETLTAAIDPTGATVTYQWYRGTNAISGATGANYTVQTDDIGFTLTAAATGTGDYQGEASETTAVVPKAVLAVPNLTLTAEGTDKIIYTVGAVENAVGYQVEYSTEADFSSSVQTASPTSPGAYPLENLDVNTTYYFRVRALAGVSDIYTDSDWSVVKSAATGKISLTDVTISGTAEVGETLTAAVVPAGADVTYQWYRGTEAISGANGAGYTVQMTDIGYALTVTANGTGNYQGDVSESTAVVPKIILAVPTLSAAAVGTDKISYTIGSVEHASGYLVEYSLNADFTASTSVAKANAGGYTLSDLTANRNYYFRVKATGSDDYADSAWSETANAATEKISLTEVTISGTAEVGETLTATVAPTDADATYQWYRGTEAISGANGAGYTVQMADIGYALTVTATGTGDYQGEDSDKTEVVPKIDLAVPTLSAAANGSDTIAYTIGSVEHAGGYLIEYSLDMNFTTPTSVAKANAGGYTLSDLAANTTYYFRARATGTDDYADSAWSDIKSAMTEKIPLVDVTISGTAVVGETLTAEIVPTGADVIYQWYRGTEAISGETGTSYKVTIDDIGYALTVTATGTGDYQGEDSDITEVVPKIDLAVPTLSVSADGSDAITYTIGTVEHAVGYLVEYSLDANFTASTSVTQTTAGDCTLSDLAANRTYYFRVKATGSAVYADSDWSETMSAATDKISLTEVTISGTAKVGETLTASITPAGAEASYQWYRGTDAIVGATGASYTVQVADVSYILTVQAIGTSDYQGTVSKSMEDFVPEAPSIIVNSLDDAINDSDWVTTLREAIIFAGTGELETTITFDESLNGGTITLALGELAIGKTVTIDASALADGITISADDASRVLNIGEEGDVTLNGITVTGGNVADGKGGGILNSGRLVMNGGAIVDNSANFFGGVYNGGKLKFVGTTISENLSANWGGGIGNAGMMSLTDSLVVRNQAATWGAGIANLTSGELWAVNVTIADNIGSGFGDGINNRGTAELINSIIVQNAKRFDVYPVNGSITAYYTISSFSGWASGSSDNYRYDANLPLFIDEENGDYSLVKDSQAIDRGDNEFVTTILDAAKNARIEGAAVDLGALESNYISLLPPEMTLSAVGNTINVNIAEEAGADGYLVEYSLSSEFDETTTVSLSVNAGDFSIGNLAEETSYYFRAKAVGDEIHLDSDWSEVQSATTGSLLTDVVLSTQTPKLGATITASLAPAAAEATWQWYRGTNADNVSEAILGANGSNYTVAEEDLDCYLKVVAIGANGYTGEVSATSGSKAVRVEHVVPQLSIRATGYAGNQVLKLSLDAHFPTEQIVSRWVIDWGDGSAPTEFNRMSNYLSTAYCYQAQAADRTYSVSLQMIDDTGYGSAISYVVATHTVSGQNAAFAAPLADIPSTVVTTTSDTVDDTDGEISLREAIQYAGTGSLGTTITFANTLSKQTITLTSGELVIDKSITISAEDVTIDAGSASRVFKVFNRTETIDVALSGLTITGGAADDGAGIYVNGERLTLTDCVISNNAASAYGGGIFAQSADLDVTHSVIRENSAGVQGGGVFVGSGSTEWTTFEDVEIADNSARVGGGIAFFSGSGEMTGVTITGNAASKGGGIWIESRASDPAVSLVNSIVAENVNNDDIYIKEGNAVATNALSSFTDWESGSVGTLLFTEGDVLFKDAENGNYQLAATSKAINAGDHTLSKTSKQVVTTGTVISHTDDLGDLAGNTRWDGTEIDLGAYEYHVTSTTAKNVIVMIGDGMGFTSDIVGTYYRYGEGQSQSYHNFTQLASATFALTAGNTTFDETSPESYSSGFGDTADASLVGYDSDFFWQSLANGRTTPDTNQAVTTDSAASGSALNNGQKIVSGFLNQIGNNGAAGTVELETTGQKASEDGKSVGAVSSVWVSNATPASVMTHNQSRNNYLQISTEEIDEQSGLTVLMGAGDIRYVYPGNTTYNRTAISVNNVGGTEIWNDLLDGEYIDANGNTVTYIGEHSDFSAYAEATPDSDAYDLTDVTRLVGIAHAAGCMDPIDGDITATEAEIESAEVPTLSEMSVGALNILSHDEDGFYLMIEGGAIDYANHNDYTGNASHPNASTQEERVLNSAEEHTGFSKAIDAVIEWVETYSSWDETLLIITADHETGQLWGEGTYTDTNNNMTWNSSETFNGFQHIVNNGEGETPGGQFCSGSHTNALVPVWLYGAGADQVENYVRGYDETASEFYGQDGYDWDGSYIYNSDIGKLAQQVLGNGE